VQKILKYKKNDPLVSIIMNCFNGERYLHESIKSILEQSYQNWEIVFWDNKSTDSSEKIFKSYCDNRFHYYKSKKHTSLYEARNYAFLKCKGEFIAFLDVDDIWFPKKLSVQIPLFNNTDVGLSCGNYIKLNERKKNDINLKPEYLSLPDGDVLNELFNENFVHFSSLMIRKKALGELKYFFDPRFNIIGDFDLLVRLCSKWKLASIQQPITYYRWHQDNTGYGGLLISHEFNIWFNEIKNNYNYKKLSNFIKFEYKTKFYNVLKLLYDGEKIKALKLINSLTVKHKLKVLIAMFLPGKLIKFCIDGF
jgi:glycosyltransferase involved in cell wall biosynthesis